MAPTKNESPEFQHMRLVQRLRGKSTSPRFGRKNAQTASNKANRAAHATALSKGASSTANAWWATQEQRRSVGLPKLSAGMALMLEIDPSLNLDELRRLIDFEIVSEEDEGFVIVASEDLDLSRLNELIKGFSNKAHGSGVIANVHNIVEDQTQEKRINRILSESLISRWATIDERAIYLVDASISCSPPMPLVNEPQKPKLEPGESPNGPKYIDRLAKYESKIKEWQQQQMDYYMAWDDARIEREKEVSRFIVDEYQGNISNPFDADTNGNADNFTVRISLTGRALKDFVVNYPYLFSVEEPDDVELPQNNGSQQSYGISIDIIPPDTNAPVVCVIDSGIQEGHLLLSAAVQASLSRCFIPHQSQTDVGDGVSGGGHGTRVAGAIVYGSDIPTSGQYRMPFWIQNARVLDGDCNMPIGAPQADLIRQIVTYYAFVAGSTKIFNHSINGVVPCRVKHMSSWAGEIDLLTSKFDILIVQSAGNVSPSSPIRYGVKEHVVAGRQYPQYLHQESCRIANPGQSLQALTVGSISAKSVESQGWKSFATGPNQPSAFSRSGLGIWDSIKPEVVEYGGDYLIDQGSPPNVGFPPAGRDCYPLLVRASSNPPGPAVERDSVGTSYAAPKVTRIAAAIQEILPTEPALLYRALIVQSARWPSSVFDHLCKLYSLKGAAYKKHLAAMSTQFESAIRTLGFGIPDLPRATGNSEHRITFISDGLKSIKSRECHVYQINIPESVRSPSNDYDILIEVTVSYRATPRRTRRTIRRYLGVWLEWSCSRRNEDISSFSRRCLDSEDSETSQEEEEGSENERFVWVLGNQHNHGIVKNARRSSGTVQKDWTICKSYALPENFCIAVVGHKGWSQNPNEVAQYTVVVSFEILGKEVGIYNEMKNAALELQEQLVIQDELTVEV